MDQVLNSAIEWISDFLSQQKIDLADGFPLLQAMSLLDSSSVKLEWYASEGAFSCADLSQKIWEDCETGLRRFGMEVPDEPDELSKVERGLILIHQYVLRREIQQEKTKNEENKYFKSINQIKDVEEMTTWANLSDSEENDNDTSDYEISEPAFKGYIRWALSYIKYHGKLALKKKCLAQIKSLQILLRTSSKEVDSEQFLPFLCSGQLYSLVCAVIYPDLTLIKIVEDMTIPVDSFHFLDVLMSKGFLNFNNKMKMSINDIIADQSPFYESIHMTILDSLMTASRSNFQISRVNYEINRLLGLDKKISLYEDAIFPGLQVTWMLDWLNAVLFQTQTDPIVHLVRDTADYKVLFKVLNYYLNNNEELTNHNVSVARSDGPKNWLKEVIQLCKEHNLMMPCWLSQEVFPKEVKRKSFGSKDSFIQKSIQSFENMILTYFYHCFDELLKREGYNASNSSIENVELPKSNLCQTPKTPLSTIDIQADVENGLIPKAAENFEPSIVSKVKDLLLPTLVIPSSGSPISDFPSLSEPSKPNIPLVSQSLHRKISSRLLSRSDSQSNLIHLKDRNTSNSSASIKRSGSEFKLPPLTIPVHLSLPSLFSPIKMPNQISITPESSTFIAPSLTASSIVDERPKTPLASESLFLVTRADEPKNEIGSDESFNDQNNSSAPIIINKQENHSDLIISDNQNNQSTSIVISDQTTILELPRHESDSMHSILPGDSSIESTQEQLDDHMSKELLEEMSITFEQKQDSINECPAEFVEESTDLIQISDDGTSQRTNEPTDDDEESPFLSEESNGSPKSFMRVLSESIDQEVVAFEENERRIATENERQTLFNFSRHDLNNNSRQDSNIIEEVESPFMIAFDHQQTNKKEDLWTDEDEKAFLQSKQMWQELLEDNEDKLPPKNGNGIEEESVELLAPAAEPASMHKMADGVENQGTGFMVIELDPEEKDMKLEKLAKKSASIEKRLEREAQRRQERADQKEQRKREEEEKQKKMLKEKKRSASLNRKSLSPQKEETRVASNQSSPIKTQSNRQLIRNALQHVCLAGPINASIKEQVMKDLDDSELANFVILFKGQKNQIFRGLYSFDPELEQVLKIYPGTQGPDVLDIASIVEFYKYDSGSRSFKAIPTKNISRNVHAVAIGMDALKVGHRKKGVTNDMPIKEIIQ